MPKLSEYAAVSSSSVLPPSLPLKGTGYNVTFKVSEIEILSVVRGRTVHEKLTV
jgi:hypothetical protein